MSGRVIVVPEESAPPPMCRRIGLHRIRWVQIVISDVVRLLYSPAHFHCRGPAFLHIGPTLTVNDVSGRADTTADDQNVAAVVVTIRAFKAPEPLRDILIHNAVNSVHSLRTELRRRDVNCQALNVD